MNVFLDTNVVIDFLGQRDGFFNDAAFIFSLVKDKIIKASTSALTVVNCAYILRKAFGKDAMLSRIDVLCQLLDVTSIDRQALLDAAKIKPYDYEDAVQYFSSLSSHPDVIITRDEKGFRDLGILVMTPAEFVVKVKNQ